MTLAPSLGLATRRLLLVLVATSLLLAVHPAAGLAACANPVACENEKPGSAPTTWQVNGAGDSSIQGYATTMGVNKGQTIRFKIKTPSSNYHINIFRLGYYQGNGARLQASGIRPTASLPQTQPACLVTASTGLIDCGNWGVSASWAVPADAVSGVYIALLVRDDTGGESQIPFVVRDDAGSSDMVIKTSDATWQAYNAYGGNSLYGCTVSCPPGNPRAYKGAFSVSYNRPFDGTIPQDGGMSYLYYAEYQLIRFVERNGYDVSYIDHPDLDANPALLRNHKLIISSGHDEYWTPGERTAFESARDAGVNLAFFSGNEVFWKTRWENSSADGTSTPRRTLTTYKDTHFDAATDPVAWTGTWADPRFAAPGDGGLPQNSLTGQLFVVNSGSTDITVPAQYKSMRLWRDTAVANLGAGQSRTLAPGGRVLGYEWDIDADNGFRPGGMTQLSSTTVNGVESFTDYGSATQQNTTQTHHLTMYRAPSGARVFGAGTVQWAWGLDTTNAWANNGPPGSVDPVMQQATINLFADMGQQATTLMPGMVAETPSTDVTAPSTTIASPTQGSAIADGTRVTISGTAADTGGVVAGVEVSMDNGASWHPATGTTSWTYSWIAHGAPNVTIKVRSVDDSTNVGTAASVDVAIGCPCTLAGPNVTPTTLDGGDATPVEVGVKFKADLDGTITGVRFYKATANTGTHVGNLWTTSGTLLATGNFSGETASGWQQMTFATPVNVSAGTTYVASYYAPRGHYSVSSDYFYWPSPFGGNSLDSPPLHAISANHGGANGIYRYSASSVFPNNTFDGENYAVDVSFTPKLPPGPVGTVTATAGPGSASVSFVAPATGGTPTRYTVTPFIGSVAQPAVVVTGNPPSTTVVVGDLDPSNSYTFKVQPANGSGSGPVSAASNAVTPTPPAAPSAPLGVIAGAGSGQANVRWTAPSDGGRTITRYTVTPYIAGVAQAVTTVTGSPAPTSAVVPGLANGTSYTFTVSATNSVGTSGESAMSGAVTPSAIPRFVQQVSGRSNSGTTLQLTPTATLTYGDRLVVMAGVWESTAPTAASVTDSAGNTYTKVSSVKASEGTELSVWTAPITAGDGTRPTITITATGGADIGGAAVEYSGLSTASGTASVDAFKTASGTSTGSGFVTSGPTAALTGDNELAVGFYVDSGFGRSLVADTPSYVQRVNVSPTDDMEFLTEDAVVARGDTPAARVSTGAAPWTMATVVFKNGGVPSPPTLSVSPASLSFSATAGGASPAAKPLAVSNSGGGTMSWTASESASWLAVSPGSGTNSGTITVTPDITGLAAGTYTTDVTVSAAGAGGSPKTIPVTLTVDPVTPPALSVTPASLSFGATAGGVNPAAKPLSVSNTGGGSMSWTASETAAWLSVSPASGTNAGTITVTPDITGLAAGTYTTDVTVTAAGATGSPKTIPVTLTVDPVTPPALSVSPASLSFNGTQGGASPAAKTLSVSNTGGGTLSWTASDDVLWLSVSPGSGTNNGTITVTPTTAGLSAGTYTATVTVDGAGASGSPKTIPVMLTVDPPPPPALAVSPASLTFNATSGGSNPAAQNVSVSNTGTGTLDVSASDDAAWLTVTPGTATAPATLSVAPNITGLAVGTYTATVTVTATTAGATGSPKTVAVTLNVNPSVSANLVGAWGFDEASGTTATDGSGRGNTGTLTGTTRTTAGKFGGALSFNGVSDWVTVPDANILDLTTGMTMEAWVRPTAIGALWRAVMIKEQPNNLIYALYAGDGAGHAGANIFNTADRGVTGTAATPLNAWTHLAATYDGANLRLYVNGVQAATRAVTGSIKASTGVLRIGGDSIWSDEWFSGLIDEVRLYNRALTATEIQADMTKAVSG